MSRLGFDPAAVRFDDRGLVPVVAQDIVSGAVLMVAWANREALRRTAETGRAWFWSRSRGALWQKGETSGNVLELVDGRLDCDADTVLLRVLPSGPACHEGTRSCFDPEPARLELGWLFEILRRRAGASREESYTAKLLAEGTPRIAQKVGEEATETIVAALSGESGAADLPEEAADLLYHLLVLLLDRGVDPTRVGEVLRDRHFREREAGS